MTKTWKPHKPWKEYPLITCSSMNECTICKKPILLGDKYYDGGYNLRAHKRCVDIGENMATTFESISLDGLRLAHLRQLSSYVHDRDREGWYYGPKDRFEKRHADLVRWIDSAVKYAESEGVKMPIKKNKR